MVIMTETVGPSSPREDPRITNEAVMAAAKAVSLDWQNFIPGMRAALEAAVPLLDSRPLLDREAVQDAIEGASSRSETVIGRESVEAFSDEFADAVMALARPMPTRETLVRAIDPDAFDEGKPRSKHPAAVIQWAARRHMAYNAADAVLALINGSAK